jgi:uncharacterized protein
MADFPFPSGDLKRAAPLSDQELQELDEFLLSDSTSDETMVLEVLDGYLTALVVGPVAVMPSLWLPRVWGPSEDDAPEFDTMEQAERIIGLILRHMNGIIQSVTSDVRAHEMIIASRRSPADGREWPDAEMWAHGFMQAVMLCRRDWEPLFSDDEASAALRPIRLLGADDLTKEELLLIRTVEQRGKLSELVPASLTATYRFWLPYREARRERPAVRRAQPRVGRNDPCPCGSGKKFKRCCGAG